MRADDLTSAFTAGRPVYTAIAVCGCGHDGRLGIGQDAPSAMSEIALIDDFLPAFCGATTTVGEVRQVACGAYHTLVLTSTGLYGWGLHEDGQLGLGRPSTPSTRAEAGDSALSSLGATAKVVPTHVDKPLQIPLAEVLRRDAEVEDVPINIVSVHCGADHSFVYTTAGVYVTGRNDCGQLGLGHTNNVYTWTRLCAALPLPKTPDRNGAPTKKSPSAASPIFSYLPSACDSDRGGVHARLLYGRLTHISCGTHHTLLAWRDAVILRAAALQSPDFQQSPLNSGEDAEAVYYPSLLMACGRGDFGELGYDGDPWEVLQAKAQRQERALRSALQHQQLHGGSDDAQHGSSDKPYKFKWKTGAAVKPRRPPFHSAFFEVVRGLKHLEENVMMILPVDCVEEVCAALLHRDCTAHGLAEDLIRHLHERTATNSTNLPPTGSTLETPSGATSRWEVANLQAMHLHSAVTLRRRDAAAAVQQLVLHWGCYYCSEIEDEAASHPRDAFGDVIDAFDSDDAGEDAKARRGWYGGIHAGEERLLRYSVSCVPAVAAAQPCGAPSSHVTMLQIMGSGNLGLGTDDSFAPSWVNLACSDDPRTAGSQSTAQSVVGRSHYLIWMDNQGVSSSVGPSSEAAVSFQAESAVASLSCVFGFGENLHGQIGAPASRVGDASNEDVVVTPRLVLRNGDVLRVATAVKQSLRDTAAAPAHHRRTPSAKIYLPLTTAAVVHHYEVVAIRGAQAGARHSLFLVDVRPVAAAAAPVTTGV
ncbi:hypothetical protein JKF63_06995 [Porcisia hertigi]|uniref:Chromatin binding protein n=1 Tax=Porcisia hertigi TaxID=2761500 RepID=A0A836IZ56_9TRYP|nr:hypothetical protein JKF63_06995 [Porcisia hertigi]